MKRLYTLLIISLFSLSSIFAQYDSTDDIIAWRFINLSPSFKKLWESLSHAFIKKIENSKDPVALKNQYIKTLHSVRWVYCMGDLEDRKSEDICGLVKGILNVFLMTDELTLPVKILFSYDIQKSDLHNPIQIDDACRLSDWVYSDSIELNPLSAATITNQFIEDRVSFIKKDNTLYTIYTELADPTWYIYGYTYDCDNTYKWDKQYLIDTKFYGGGSIVWFTGMDMIVKIDWGEGGTQPLVYVRNIQKNTISSFDYDFKKLEGFHSIIERSLVHVDRCYFDQLQLDGKRIIKCDGGTKENFMRQKFLINLDANKVEKALQKQSFGQIYE